MTKPRLRNTFEVLSAWLLGIVNYVSDTNELTNDWQLQAQLGGREREEFKRIVLKKLEFELH